VKTRCNLAESSNEGNGSKRAVVPTMMRMRFCSCFYSINRQNLAQLQWNSHFNVSQVKVFLCSMLNVDNLNVKFPLYKIFLSLVLKLQGTLNAGFTVDISITVV
jgi:hypothetical protein